MIGLRSIVNLLYLKKNVALLKLGATTSAASFAAGVIFFGLVADAFIKGGIRMWTGSQIICENGNLFVKKSNGDKIIILKAKPGFKNKLKEYFLNPDIGAAQIYLERSFCKDPKIMKEVNKLASKAFRSKSLIVKPSSSAH